MRTSGKYRILWCGRFSVISQRLTLRRSSLHYITQTLQRINSYVFTCQPLSLIGVRRGMERIVYTASLGIE